MVFVQNDPCPCWIRSPLVLLNCGFQKSTSCIAQWRRFCCHRHEKRKNNWWICSLWMIYHKSKTKITFITRKNVHSDQKTCGNDGVLPQLAGAEHFFSIFSVFPLPAASWSWGREHPGPLTLPAAAATLDEIVWLKVRWQVSWCLGGGSSRSDRREKGMDWRG